MENLSSDHHYTYLGPEPVEMTQHDHRKPSIDCVEEVTTSKHYVAEDMIALPTLLEGSSDAELKKIGQRATWKLDFIIMPAMTM